MSSSLLLMDPLSSSSPTSQATSPSRPSSPLPSETTKFLYSSLHRVDNLVRRYHQLRTESNSQANLLAHLSTRLSLMAHSTLAHSTRTTIDYDNRLCPPHLSLADRMSISLKENLDRVMNELDSSLTEMELLYLSVRDILVTIMCQSAMAPRGSSAEWERGIKYIGDTYMVLVSEIEARRNLWYSFTADEKRKSFMAASTLGDILLTPPVEWEKFAQEWVALDGKEDRNRGDGLDDLTDAMGSWGQRDDGDGIIED